MALLNNRFTEADRLYSSAVSLLSDGDIAGAASLLLEITQRFENYGKAWSEMGDIIQYHLKDPDAAAEYYRKAIEVTPLYTNSYLGYADVLFSQEKFAEVNAIINQVMEIAGVRKDLALQKSAILMESQGRYDEAIESYKAAILISFSEEEISKCEKGINRCNVKKKYS
jgi:tetratricopeptide (TPR) repeat protein